MAKFKCNNDWAKAVYLVLLDYTAGTNMKKVLGRSPLFWKFQSRISDVCKYHQTFRSKLNKVPLAFKDQYTGKEGYYFQYTFLGDKKYLQNLMNKLNEKGLYRSHKPKK